jgi:DNA-binding MurR/RpiR family transcriptional regulator
MKKSCLYEIHSLKPGMSEKDRRVADFILADPAGAVHPSIEELAERIGVSESTLFRFVRKLGYGGYQQFRIALATETVEPKKTVYENLASRGDETPVSLVFRTNIAALENTMDKLDRQSLDTAAGMMVKAGHLLLFGLGGSSIVAQDAFHKFVRTGLNCCAPLDFHLQLMVASQSGPADTALIVSHSGVNKDSLTLADEVKRMGTYLIVLSDYPRTPLTKLADLSLVSYTTGSRYASEAFSARIVQLAIIDALYVGIMDRLGERGVEHLERMREAIARRRT